MVARVCLGVCRPADCLRRAPRPARRPARISGRAILIHRAAGLGQRSRWLTARTTGPCHRPGPLLARFLVVLPEVKRPAVVGDLQGAVSSPGCPEKARCRPGAGYRVADATRKGQGRPLLRAQAGANGRAVAVGPVDVQRETVTVGEHPAKAAHGAGPYLIRRAARRCRAGAAGRDAPAGGAGKERGHCLPRAARGPDARLMARAAPDGLTAAAPGHQDAPRTIGASLAGRVARSVTPGFCHVTLDLPLPCWPAVAPGWRSRAPPRGSPAGSPRSAAAPLACSGPGPGGISGRVRRLATAPPGVLQDRDGRYHGLHARHKVAAPPGSPAGGRVTG